MREQPLEGAGTDGSFEPPTLAAKLRAREGPVTPRPSPVRIYRAMTFTLDEVVPWGRSFDEYAAMFALDAHDLSRRILGCADGPASFNAEASAGGTRVVSCDPLYQFTPAEIASRIGKVAPLMLEQTRANRDGFVWDRFASVEELGRARHAAMDRFLAHYARARADRYVAAALPTLPFPDNSFDLALSSHFLFLYSAQLGFDFHLAAVRELCRVANEVRIFPILTLGRDTSPYLNPLIDALARDGWTARLERVGYEFQRGGHTMLRCTFSVYSRVVAWPRRLSASSHEP